MENNKITLLRDERNYNIAGFFIGFFGGLLGFDRFYRAQFITGFLKLVFIAAFFGASILEADITYNFFGFLWWMFDNIFWAKRAKDLHNELIGEINEFNDLYN